MKETTKNMTLAAMFLAIGLLLPLLTGQIPQIGNMLLPMHIPVFLCGLICGWQYGAVVGLILPLVRYVIFGMPALFPTGIAMSFELMTYGLVAGLLYGLSRWQCVFSLYRSLLAAMVAGRIVWGIVQMILNAIPGIIVQLILIPMIMVALNRTGLVRFRKQQPMMQEAES